MGEERLHADRRQARLGHHRRPRCKLRRLRGSAAIDHIHDWCCGSEGRWVTMGVPSDGSYGVPEGMIFGFPCIVKEDGTYEIVKGLELTEDTKARIAKNVAELQGEQQAVAAFVPN